MVLKMNIPAGRQAEIAHFRQIFSNPKNNHILTLSVKNICYMVWCFSFGVLYQAEMRNILDDLTGFCIFP